MNLLNEIITKNKVPQRNETISVKPNKTTSLKPEYKPDILDILSEKVVNKRDLTDTVTVPRTIFKGYLCFTAGTAINSIASLTGDGKFAKGLGILGNIISIYGTFNFVKPFLFKEKDLTKNEK